MISKIKEIVKNYLMKIVPKSDGEDIMNYYQSMLSTLCFFIVALMIIILTLYNTLIGK